MEKMALALVVLMCGFAAVLVIFGCFLTYYACWNYFHKKHRKRYQQEQMGKDIADPVVAGAESNKLFQDEDKKKRSVYVYFTASGLREKVENDETTELNAAV